MAEAPAMTLNSRYHCVPSSISSTAAMFSPPGKRQQGQQQHREQCGGRNRGDDLHHGLQPRGERRCVPMATPTGTVHASAIDERDHHTPQRA